MMYGQANPAAQNPLPPGFAQSPGYAPAPGYGQPGYPQQPGFHQPYHPAPMNPSPPQYALPSHALAASPMTDPMYPEKRVSTTTKLGENLTCTGCKQKITTTVTRSMNSTGYLFMFVMIYICCPLFWLPLCLDGSYDNNHSCPNCKAVLSYKL